VFGLEKKRREAKGDVELRWLVGCWKKRKDHRFFLFVVTLPT
jgi:hypothetical protein